MPIQARHACDTDFETVMLRTLDTDAAVIGIPGVGELKLKLDSLWIAFGVCKHFLYFTLPRPC